MSAGVKPGDIMEENRAAFQVFDRDGSGTISAQEMREVMKNLGENLTDQEIDEMIAVADKDNNGTIDCRFDSSSPQCTLAVTSMRYKLIHLTADEEFVHFLSKWGLGVALQFCEADPCWERPWLIVAGDIKAGFLYAWIGFPKFHKSQIMKHNDDLLLCRLRIKTSHEREISMRSQR
jgi:hypothetical protein